MNGVVAVEAELAAVLARFWETVEVPEDEDVNIEAILQRLPEPYKSDAEEIVDDMRATSTGSQMLEAVVDAAIEGGVEWPEQEMLTLLPEAVLAQFGSIDFSGVSGPCVIVPESNRRAFVEALQQWGYEVVEDEDAVRRAQPAWSG